MNESFLKLIEKKIDLYFKPSVADIGLKTARLTSNLIPPDFRNINSIINDFTSIILTKIDVQALKIIEIIKATITESKIQFSVELKGNISEICKNRINKNNYINRFYPFIDSIERHCLRYGNTRFDKTDNSINLLASKFDALIKTKVRSSNENIQSELDILLFAQKTEKSKSLKKDIQPNLDWYLNISNSKKLSPRCPHASVYRCPRFYQSLSLLGEAGSTSIDAEEDLKLKKAWEMTDVWPTVEEQATSISGPENKTNHFSVFCPEVSFDRFGLFAIELHKYSDKIDRDNAQRALSDEQASDGDWRWNWSHISPLHYTECSLYSLLSSGKVQNAPKPDFPDLGMPDSITTHTISVTEADNLTANDIEDLIRYMYEHNEVKVFEVYYSKENPYLKKAIDDFKIQSDTVEMHYYKNPNHELSFLTIHKNTAKSDWEKHLIATTPMYFKRVISLTEKIIKKMDEKENQTIWDRLKRHPVFIMITLVGSIASILAYLYIFTPKNTNGIDAKLESSPNSVIYQAGGDIVIQPQPSKKNIAPHQEQLTYEKENNPKLINMHDTFYLSTNETTEVKNGELFITLSPPTVNNYNVFMYLDIKVDSPGRPQKEFKNATIGALISYEDYELRFMNYKNGYAEIKVLKPDIKLKSEESVTVEKIIQAIGGWEQGGDDSNMDTNARDYVPATAATELFMTDNKIKIKIAFRCEEYRGNNTTFSGNQTFIVYQPPKGKKIDRFEAKGGNLHSFAGNTIGQNHKFNEFEGIEKTYWKSFHFRVDSSKNNDEPYVGVKGALSINVFLKK